MRYTLTAVVALSFLVACSAHSPMIVKNTVDSAPASAPYAAHKEKVFLTEEQLPASDYDVVSQIDVGRIWYGGSSNVLASMAHRARELGADAVIEVKQWRQPSGFSWAAPHGSGKAVKFKDKQKVDLSKVKGQWL